MRCTYCETVERGQPDLSLARRTMISERRVGGQVADSDTLLKIKQIKDVLINSEYEL